MIIIFLYKENWYNHITKEVTATCLKHNIEIKHNYLSHINGVNRCNECKKEKRKLNIKNDIGPSSRKSVEKRKNYLKRYGVDHHMKV